MAKYVQHLDFMKRLDDAMKNIIHVGQINAYDIPAIVVLCVELIAVKGTVDVNAIQNLFDFILDHYNLSPSSDNDTLKEDFQKMFDRCLTLLSIKAATKQLSTKAQKIQNIWRKLTSSCCGRKGVALINTEIADPTINTFGLLPVIDIDLPSISVTEPVWDTVGQMAVVGQMAEDVHTVVAQMAEDVHTVVGQMAEDVHTVVAQNAVVAQIVDEVTTVVEQIVDEVTTIVEPAKESVN